MTTDSNLKTMAIGSSSGNIITSQVVVTVASKSIPDINIVTGNLTKMVMSHGVKFMSSLNTTMLEMSHIIGNSYRCRGTTMEDYSEAVCCHKLAVESGDDDDAGFYKNMKTSLMEEMKTL